MSEVKDKDKRGRNTIDKVPVFGIKNRNGKKTVQFIQMVGKFMIENFWGWAKIRLVKFRVISRITFQLHLKECEFRFNNRDLLKEEMYIKILKIVRNLIKWSYALN